PWLSLTRPSRRLGGRPAPLAWFREQVEGLRVPRRADELRRRLEAVLHQELQVVALVEHLDLHVGVELDQPARLAVLLGDQLLVERGDLDVEVVRRQVEVEQLRELSFGVVREADLLVRQRLRGNDQPPSATRSSATCSRTPALSSSITCASGTMLSTPWPRRTRSMSMSSV